MTATCLRALPARRHRTITRAAFSLTLGIATLLAACDKPVEAPEPVVRPVKIQTIGEADPASRREYPGSIRAMQSAELAFEVSGQIIEFFVFQSQTVVQGEVIARLDPRNYEADLKAATANLNKAEADLKRSLNIFKEDPGAISKQTIDGHRRAVEVASANVDVAKKAVEDTRLRAPFSGRLARKLVEDYQNVKAKEAVAILQDTSTLQIEINVPERDVVRSQSAYSVEAINANSNPEVIVSALPDRKFAARVEELATVADPVTRTFLVKLSFDNSSNALILPGMTARVQVTTNPDSAFSLPVSAALSDPSGKAFVWKVDPQAMTVSKVAVELGELADTRVRVKSGIGEGDLVAISGVHQLREGMKVRRYE